MSQVGSDCCCCCCCCCSPTDHHGVFITFRLLSVGENYVRPRTPAIPLEKNTLKTEIITFGEEDIVKIDVQLDAKRGGVPKEHGCPRQWLLPQVAFKKNPQTRKRGIRTIQYFNITEGSNGVSAFGRLGTSIRHIPQHT